MDESVKSFVLEHVTEIESNAACLFLPCIRFGSGSPRSTKADQDMEAATAREEEEEEEEESHEFPQGRRTPNGRNNKDDDDEEEEGFPASPELLEAARSGDEAKVESILRAGGVNVNARECSSSALTALHHAARGNNDTVLKLLLGCPGVDVDARDGFNRSPLMLASELGRTRALELLLQKGADPLICDKGGFNCLHLAARGGHSGVVALLLEDDDHDRFWHIKCARLDDASHHEVPQVTPSLRVDSSGPSVNSFRPKIRLQLMEQKSCEANFTALHMAAKGGHVSTTVQLLRAYITLSLKDNGFTNYPHHHDLITKFLDRVKLVVSTIHAADSAECKAHVDTVIRYKLKSFWESLIIDKRSNNWEMQFSDIFCLQQNEVQLHVDRLVDAFVQVISYSNSADKSKRTCLHMIALNCHVHREARDAAKCANCFVKQLLELGTLNVNAPDIDGNTPLHLACEVDNVCLVRHSLNTSLIPNLGASNWNGHSPLRSAFIHKQPLYKAPGHKLCTSSHNLLCHQFGRLRGLKVQQPGPARSRTGWEPESCSVSELLEREVIVRFGKLEGSDRGLLRAASELLWSLKELLERRQIMEDEDQRLGKGLELEDHYGGLTLLHYAAFRGFSNELHVLLKLAKFQSLVNLASHGTGQSPLHLAVIEGQKEVVKVLLDKRRRLKLRTTEEDGFDRAPVELARACKSFYDSNPGSEHWKVKLDDLKHIESMLLDDEDVQQSIRNLISLRQDFVVTTSANLIAATLIASITYGGWLHPPLGLQPPTPNVTWNPRVGFPEAYAAIGHKSVRCFWVLNSLSFFFAIAAVVSGAGVLLKAASVKKPSSYCVAEDVKHVQGSLLRTSLLLVISISCLVGAFGAAGFAVLPPLLKYQSTMIVTVLFGSTICLIHLYSYFHGLVYTLPRRLRAKLQQWTIFKTPLSRWPTAVKNGHSSFDHGLYQRSSWSLLGT